METRESLNLKTKPEIKELLKARKIGGYSTKKKDELVEMYLNPPAAGATRSPGRPPGTTVAAGAAKPAKGTRKPRTGLIALTVRYDKQGLNGLTGMALKQLAVQKQLVGLSGKNKDAIIDSLLTKPHPTDLTIMVQSKTGATKSFTVLGTGGAGGALVGVQAAAPMIQLAPVAQPAMAPLPQLAGMMVPPIQFRQ